MRIFGALPTVLLVLGTASVAGAQEFSSTSRVDTEGDTTSDMDDVDVEAPDEAFELALEGGYTQPFGRISSGNDVHDVVEAGAAFGLRLGYRINPRWSIEGTGQYHESEEGDDYDRGTDLADVRGIAGGVQGTYHFRPHDRVDPYTSFGAGYRAMWVVPEVDSTTVAHGIQAARVVVGVDFRATEDVALGPMVGADLTVFLDDAEVDDTDDGARPSTFLFAGVGGRFDVGGDRVGVERPTLAATSF